MPTLNLAVRIASSNGGKTGVVMTRFGVDAGVTPPNGGEVISISSTGVDVPEDNLPSSDGKTRVNSRLRGT